MSGVCGWLAGRPKGDRPGGDRASGDPAGSLASMTGALAALAGERLASRSGPGGGLALQARDPVEFAAEGGIWCAIDGAIEGTWPAAEGGPAHALIEAYRRQGTGLLQGVRGSFAFAVLDIERRRALLAVDRRGVKRLAWQAAPDGSLLFASSLDALRAHPAARSDLSAQAIFDFLHHSVIPAPASIFRDVHKLLAAEYLLFEDGRVTTGRYWEPAPEQPAGPVDRLGRETVDCIRAAVRRSMDGVDGDATGAFLSGGLDSSTVLGLATEVVGRPMKSFTIGFESELYDELGYATIAARHFGSEHHVYYVTPADAAALLPRIAAVYDEPFGNSSAVPAYFCAGLARDHGISLMLAGDGGDEIFGGNERYLQQQVFDIYGRIPAPLRLMLETGLKVLPGSGSLPLVRKAASYVRRARTPMPDRMMTYGFLGGDRLAEVFSPDFLAEVDPDGPLEALRQTYRLHQAGPLLRRMLQFDMQVTLADNDLRKVSGMCDLAGMDVRFPFLDEAVIDLGTRLPSDLLIRGGRLRDFYKRAFRGILPEEVIKKQKHGFGMPVRFWIAEDTALREAVGDAFTSLRRRRIVRPEFLDRLLDDRDAQSSGAFGQLGWYLAVLEGWLASRRLGI